MFSEHQVQDVRTLQCQVQPDPWCPWAVPRKRSVTWRAQDYLNLNPWKHPQSGVNRWPQIRWWVSAAIQIWSSIQIPQNLTQMFKASFPHNTHQTQSFQVQQTPLFPNPLTVVTWSVHERPQIPDSISNVPILQCPDVQRIPSPMAATRLRKSGRNRSRWAHTR